jgi:uncharacterized protein (DUF2235 family)
LVDKRIAIFLDGTWNTLNNNTNVWRLKSLCAPDEPGQFIYYSQGVGTRFGEKVVGGVEGYGLDNEIIDAYTWLVQVFEVGDDKRSSARCRAVRARQFATGAGLNNTRSSTRNPTS